MEAPPIFDLLDSGLQDITNMETAEALRRVGSGNAAKVAEIEGSFALLTRDGIRVRMARTLDRPMRFFMAKDVHGPALVVSDRIDRIGEFLETRGWGDQFHPSYTRMVPAHHLFEVEMRGCPDPSPVATRFFDPPQRSGTTDLDEMGVRYISAVAEELRRWIDGIDPVAPIGVAFSGGIDSGAVLLLVHHILESSGLGPQRLKAFTLSVAGSGADAKQASNFLREVGLGVYLETIDVPARALDVERTISILEDYKALDVESGTSAIALLEGIRDRYPEWSYLVDGDGGDENLKDYPIEENAELTIRSVLNNPMLYQEGWGVGALKHSQTYSGGQSRSYVRTWAPARHFGFRAFSPYTRRPVIAAAEDIPFVELTGWDHDRLYSLKGDIVRRGVLAITGIDMPIFEKRRFQHGVMDADRFQTTFSEDETRYRALFHALHA